MNVIIEEDLISVSMPKSIQSRCKNRSSQNFHIEQSTLGSGDSVRQTLHLQLNEIRHSETKELKIMRRRKQN